jgi:hypothetical protein
VPAVLIMQDVGPGAHSCVQSKGGGVAFGWVLDCTPAPRGGLGLIMLRHQKESCRSILCGE